MSKCELCGHDVVKEIRTAEDKFYHSLCLKLALSDPTAREAVQYAYDEYLIEQGEKFKSKRLFAEH